MKWTIITAFLILAGCETVSPATRQPGQAVAVNKAAEVIGKSCGYTFTAAAEIRDSVETIQATTQEPKTQEQAARIGKNTAVIEAQKPVIAGAVETLNTAAPEIEKAEAVAVKTDETIEAKDKQIAELKEKNNTLLNKMLTVFILAGTVILAVSIYLFMSGNPKAISAGIAGGALILCSMAVNVLTRLTTLFIWLAGAGVVVIVGALGYQAWLYIKQRKAVVQVVQSVEAIKPELTAEAKAKLFGSKAAPGSLSDIQDNDTKAIVKQVKSATV